LNATEGEPGSGGGALPRPAPNVVYQEVEGEVVLVHLGTNRIYSLNATGARFWQLLESGCDREAAEAHLAREFEVSGSQVAAEVGALLESLRAEGLVE
jgi:hypothetical protein